MSDVRERVYELVERYPGVHAREVERQLGLASRLASYHLDALEAAGRLRRVEERGFLRYLATRASMPEADLALLCRLRRTPVLEIVLFLVKAGEAAARQISDEIGLAKPSTSYHLGELLRDGVLRVRPSGRERWYSLVDPAQARRVLDGFEPLPGEMDAFASIWDDLTR